MRVTTVSASFTNRRASAAFVPTRPIVLVHVTTVPESLEFLRHQVGILGRQGFDVHVVSSPGAGLERFAQREGARAHPIVMPRRITPWADVVALFHLWRLFRVLRPDIVHGHTPKAGLLAMIAAFLARVPLRIYNLLGLPVMTASGFRRVLLGASDRVACRLAHVVLAVSPSMRRELIERGLCCADKVRVVLGGSSFGVDARTDSIPRSTIGVCVSQLGRKADTLTLGFLGRVANEKGIGELLAAWDVLSVEFPTLRLLIVGGWEVHDPPPASVRERLSADSRIDWLGAVDDPAPYLARMDVFALPSYREGFGISAIEAAALELPVVASRIPGLVDSVEDGVTGTLIPPRDVDALIMAIRNYLLDPELRRAHGRAGRERVLRLFLDETLSDATRDEYLRLLARSEPRPQRGKRALDLVLTIPAMVVFLPVIAAIALVVRIGMGSPVIFRQTRIGKHGRPFRIWKFRTMIEAFGPDGAPLPDEARLTPLGRFLRRTSLDELPQLFNIVRGDLSIVGPRPLLPEYLPLYSDEQCAPARGDPRRHRLGANPRP